MKRMLALVGLVLALSFGQAGEAAVAPAKIGVVRIQNVFKDFQYAKDQEAAIKAEFKKDEDGMTALKQQMEEKKKHLQADPLIGPGSKKFKLEALELRKLEVELEDKVDEFKKASRKRMAEFYRSIYEKFQKAVADVAARRGLDLVITAPDTDLSKEAEESDSPVAIQQEILLRHVQFIGPSCDITKEVLDQMNAQYGKAKGAGKNL